MCVFIAMMGENKNIENPRFAKTKIINSKFENLKFDNQIFFYVFIAKKQIV